MFVCFEDWKTISSVNYFSCKWHILVVQRWTSRTHGWTDGNYKWKQSVKIFLLESERDIGKPIEISTENAGCTHLKIKRTYPECQRKSKQQQQIKLCVEGCVGEKETIESMLALWQLSSSGDLTVNLKFNSIKKVWDDCDVFIHMRVYSYWKDFWC